MNWNSFAPNTPVLIQGITGKEGSRMAAWLVASGVNVVGGVTPGKGGQETEGRPVFDSVVAARERFPDCVVSSIVVPPSRVLGAVEEAIAAGIRYIHVLTEQIPLRDVLVMRKSAVSQGVALLGPSSVGYLQFPRFRIGYLGGEVPFETLKEGGAAILSTSGGMANELMMSLSRHGIGVRLALALGGDRVVGLTLEDAIAWTESLEEVNLLALFVEPGRPILKTLAEGTFRFQKQAVVFLAGEALDSLPRDVPYGHTGTVLGEGDVSVHETRLALRRQGITCVGSMSEFLLACKILCPNP